MITPHQFPTLDERLATNRVAPAQRAVCAAAAEIPIDGVRYGAIRPTAASESPSERKMDRRSSERAFAAHGLAAARITNVALWQREAPDFWCSVAGNPRFGLEVAEAHHPAHAAFANNSRTIQKGVRDAIAMDAVRSTRMANVLFELRFDIAPTAATARAMRDENIAWIDHDLATTREGPILFDPARYPQLAAHRPHAMLYRNCAPSFDVELPACSFSPDELAAATLQMLSQKREKTYTIATPWLILCGTDQWGYYDDSLALLWRLREQIALELGPFTRLIVEYGGAAVVLGDAPMYYPLDRNAG